MYIDIDIDWCSLISSVFLAFNTAIRLTLEVNSAQQKTLESTGTPKFASSIVLGLLRKP